MFATVPVGIAQPPITAPASLYAGYLPDAAIGRLPQVSVAASVSAPEVHNNTRGNQTASLPATPAASTGMAAASVTGAAAQPQRGMAESSYSTLFLTQLLGQGAANSQIIVDYEKMASFSNVKYLPSQALLPKSDPAGAFAKLLQTGASAEPSPSRAPAQSADIQPRMAQARKIAAASAASRSDRPAPSLSAAVKLPASEPKSAPSSMRLTTRGTASLITPSGFDAYTATSARNEARLTRPETPIRFL